MPTKAEVEEKCRRYVAMRLEQVEDRIDGDDQLYALVVAAAECEFWRIKYWDLYEDNM